MKLLWLPPLALSALALSACAPTVSSRVLAPAVGQTWVMRGELGGARRTLTYPLVRAESNVRGEVYDRYSTSQGAEIVFYRSAETNIRILALGGLSGGQNSICAIYTTSPDAANVFRGRYYEGTVEEYVAYYRDNRNDKLGSCTLAPEQ